MEVVAIGEQVTLYTYEYAEPAGQVTRYEYLVNGEWELTCKDGSSYSFYSGYSERDTLPAVKKTAADGTVLTEIFDEKSYYIQEAYFYGSSIYSDILYQANQHVIGLDKDMLLPGMRLYIPEIWSSTGDILIFN